MALHRAQSEILSSYAPDEDFGAFIERIRRRCRIQIKEVAALFPTYLNEATCGKAWDRFTYTHLVGERKRRPRFRELLPFYKCLVVAGVHFSAAERNQFLYLTWQIIENPSASDPFPTDGRWAALLTNFADFDHLPTVPELTGTHHQNGLPHLRLIPSLQEEHRHLVGRSNWVRDMQRLVSADLPKKLVIVQAALGAGKTSALHLLQRELENQETFRSFFFTCASPVNMTAEEHLDRFLAEAFAFLRVMSTSEGEQAPLSLTQRAQLLLKHLAQARGIILFVDNGEVLLEEQGQLAACWQQFFQDFVQYQHGATLFFTTGSGRGGQDATAPILCSTNCLRSLQKLARQSGGIWVLTMLRNHSSNRPARATVVIPG